MSVPKKPTGFGPMLKVLRSKQLVNISEVARAVGVSASFLSDIELRRRQPPAYAMLEDIMDFLEVDKKDRGQYYEAALMERCAVCKYKCPKGEKDHGKKEKS